MQLTGRLPRWFESVHRPPGDGGTANNPRKSWISGPPQTRLMAAQETPASLGGADARRVAAAIAMELRDGRIGAGISQATAARAAGLSPSQWGRLERNELDAPDLDQVCRAARALGLRGHLKLYPAGEPVRDSAQLNLLARFEAALGPPLRMRREVPIPIIGDLRAWDAMVDGDGRPFFVEGESHVHDIQEVDRRIARKQRDDPRATTVVLILTRSDHHRRLLATHREALRELLPLDGVTILRSIRSGRRPPASGIALL
jgi:transcriptional regulator with XRE-family HTH domain